MMQSSKPLIIDRVVPEGRTVLSSFGLDLLVMSTAAACIALLAQVRIPLGFTPVPLTGQTLGVLVAGMALGKRRGTGSALMYLLAGGIGLPVFSGFGAGFTYISGVTGGYLFGFVLAAWLVGFLAERGWDRNFLTSAAAMAIGSGVIYLTGILWLGTHIGFGRVIELGVLPFILVDLVKVVFGATIMPVVWRLTSRRNPGS